MLLELQREVEEENRARIEPRLVSQGVSYDWAELTANIDVAIEQADLLADLIVVNCERPAGLQPNARKLSERLVTKCHAPLLAVPDQNGFHPADPVLVAWDGSDPASAALRAAIPLLQMSDSVTVYEVDDGTNDTSIEEAAQYLSRHGITPDLIREKADDSDFVEPLLLRRLESGRFDWAVMGAFSRSPLRERLFGGVTRRMLKDTPIPLVIAH